MLEGRSNGRRFALVLASAGVLTLVCALVAAANVSLTTLSTDPYTNTTSQHATEVEPDSFSFGSTIVSVTQVGRFTDGGSSDIGWATSTDGGSTWTHGFLPGLTVFSVPPGPYDRASDPSVAYDAAHGVWLVNSLALTSSSNPVVVNRSTDGGHTWGNAITVAAGGAFDKNWIVCDDTASSPFYGRCYVEFDDSGNGNRLRMEYSTDGGLTWTASSTPASSVIGGQPVVQPNGTVVMPIDDGNEATLESFVSTNGGVSYSGPNTIATITSHGVVGGLRSGPLPSAEVDGSGVVYVAWQDCRFRSGCRSNDIVISKSSNGTSWSPVARVPIGTTGDTQDHFIPGLAVDRSTSGGSAHVAVTYYYYPNRLCSRYTCQLDVGYISSANGGASWGVATQLVGPMSLTWLPQTNQGRMVGDYMSTSFGNGLAHGFFAVATAPTGTVSKDCAVATPHCHEALTTNAAGLHATGGDITSSGDQPVPGVTSNPPSATLVTLH
jgi:hypothetical protein